MKRKKKTIIGCSVGMLLVIVAGLGAAYLWLIQQEDGNVVKNYVAQRYWHKNVNPWNLNKVQQYARKFGYNDDYYIICDFGKRSGLKRFYVYDLNEKERIMQSYCMHGSGSGSTPAKPVFSNKPGSNASSLGLYALCGIGSRSLKNSIRLEGLDNTNSHAHFRGILIHSAGVVSRFNGEQKYLPIDSRLSSGCFAIDYKTLLRLMTIYKLHGRHKRILMWACYEEKVKNKKGKSDEGYQNYS